MFRLIFSLTIILVAASQATPASDHPIPRQAAGSIVDLPAWKKPNPTKRSAAWQWGSFFVMAHASIILDVQYVRPPGETSLAAAGVRNDLNCRDVRERVRIYAGNDPNRLDGDNDGWGCDDW